MSYAEFLDRKRRVWTGVGHRPDQLPPQLYGWQDAIVRWALRKGRAAIFADCGLRKTFMQVAWANALGVPTIFLAPLCVAEQTVGEAAKLGIDPYTTNPVLRPKLDRAARASFAGPLSRNAPTDASCSHSRGAFGGVLSVSTHGATRPIDFAGTAAFHFAIVDGFTGPANTIDSSR